MDAAGAPTADDSKEPAFVGRRAELRALSEAADRAKAGHGSFVLIAGEVGVGKTRLAKESIKQATEAGWQILQARCLSEAPAPYLPLFEAFRAGGLAYLLPAERPPRVEYLYLSSNLGMTMASASRTESPFDRDLFLSMLSAVETFVTDSFSGLQGTPGGAAAPRLNTLGFGEYRILIMPRPFGNLVAIIRGMENNDLVVALEEVLHNLQAQHGPALAAWDGDRSVRDQFSGPLQQLFASRRFEGDESALTPRELQYRMLESLAWGLTEEAKRNPVFLFLDDLHQADTATISAVQYLARSTREEPVLIVTTFRPEESIFSSAGHPLARARSALLQEGLAREIMLGPLDAGGVKRLAEEQLGVDDLDAPLVQAVREASHGIPLAVVEMVRYLVEEGRVEKVGGTVHLTGGFGHGRLPLQLRDAVLRRVGSLPRGDRDVLECAAVDGSVFSIERLACALGRSRLEVVRSLRQLEEEQRLVKMKGQTGWFEHTRVCAVVYEGIHADLRREYHSAIARCCAKQMEQKPSPELEAAAAHHFAKAHDPEGMLLILRAAEHAAVSAAPAEAADWYEAYLPLAGENVTASVLAAYASALLTAGRFEKAEREAARLLEHPAGEMERLTYVRMMADAVANQRGFLEALRVMDRHAPGPGGLAWARWVVARSRMALRVGQRERVEVDLNKALPIIQREGGTADQADAYASLAALWRETGDFDQAVAFGRNAVEAVGDNAPAAAEYYNLIGSGLIYRGKYGEAREALAKGAEAARSRSDPRWLAISNLNIGLLEIRGGDTSAARDALIQALRWSERLGTAQLAGRALTLLGLAAAERGRDEDAAEFYLRALPLTDRGASHRDMGRLRAYLAQFELERGDPDLAARHAKEAFNMAATGGDAPGQALALALMAGAAGVSGDEATAHKQFDQAARGLRFSPSQYEYAEVMRMWGDYLLDCGEEEAARERLTQAHEVFQEMGAKGRARRTAARLALMGPAARP